MELAEIKILIDKYYDGETTLDEEAAIANYFQTHMDIPAELEPTRAIFMATSALKDLKAPDVKPRKVSLGRMITIHLGGVAAAAAVVAGIIIGLSPEPTTKTEKRPYIACYINGEKVDDQQIAQAEANRILGGVSEDMQIAMAKIKALNITAIR